MRILCVSIHPDDFCLCIGGTMALHVRRGDQVQILVLTDGEQGGDAATRKTETLASAKILGIDAVDFLGYPDGHLNDSIDTVSPIESYSATVRPDRVYCCSFKDRHQDHRKGSRAVIAASRAVREIWLYEAVSSLTDFAPTTFVDIDSVMTQKLESVAAHRSQNTRDYMQPEFVRSWNRFRGMQVQLEHAEAFEIAKQVVTGG